MQNLKKTQKRTGSEATPVWRSSQNPWIYFRFILDNSRRELSGEGLGGVVKTSTKCRRGVYSVSNCRQKHGEKVKSPIKSKVGSRLVQGWFKVGSRTVLVESLKDFTKVLKTLRKTLRIEWFDWKR